MTPKNPYKPHDPRAAIWQQGFDDYLAMRLAPRGALSGTEYTTYIGGRIAAYDHSMRGLQLLAIDQAGAAPAKSETS